MESLSTYNNTLVSEKMDLSGDVMRLNDKLQQTQVYRVLRAKKACGVMCVVDVVPSVKLSFVF